MSEDQDVRVLNTIDGLTEGIRLLRLLRFRIQPVEYRRPSYAGEARCARYRPPISFWLQLPDWFHSGMAKNRLGPPERREPEHLSVQFRRC